MADVGVDRQPCIHRRRIIAQSYPRERKGRPDHVDDVIRITMKSQIGSSPSRQSC